MRRLESGPVRGQEDGRGGAEGRGLTRRLSRVAGPRAAHILLLLLTAGLLPSGACQRRAPPLPPAPPGEFERARRLFQQGDCQRAAVHYRRYLEGGGEGVHHPQALYHLGLCHLFAESPLADRAAAAGLFDRLVAGYPGSPEAAQARLLRSLLAELENLKSSLDSEQERVQALRRELERLKAIDMGRQ